LAGNYGRLVTRRTRAPGFGPRHGKAAKTWSGEGSTSVTLNASELGAPMMTCNRWKDICSAFQSNYFNFTWHLFQYQWVNWR